MRLRILTAAVGIPLVLAAVLCPWDGPFRALLVLVGALALWELGRLVALVWLPWIGAAGVLALAISQPGMPALVWIAATFVGAVGARLGVLGSSLCGAYVAAPLVALDALHRLGGTPNWALLAILPIWAGDTAAIFAGRAFGRHPIWPRISPKKTWEGGLSNLVFAVGAGCGLGAWIGSPALGAASGLAAGTLGQAGDFYESALKRAAGVKDSGTLLPGHGGVLDRIDSLLFTAPVVAWLATLG